MKKTINLLIAVFILTMSACSGTMPTNLGWKNNQLIPCPDKPNCVSTFAKTEQHSIAPLTLGISTKEAASKIEEYIKAQKRTEIIKSSGNYIQATFTTALMRFTDDVEIYIDESAKLIHFRSASRIGRSDLGLNRKRMDAFSKAMKDVLNP